MSLLGKRHCPLIPPWKKSSIVPPPFLDKRAVLPLPSFEKASIVLLVLSWQKGGTFLSKRAVFLSSSLLRRKAVWGPLPFLGKNAVSSLLFLVGKRAVLPTLSKAQNYPLVLSWQKGSIAPLLEGSLIPPWLTCYSNCPITAEHSMCECMLLKIFFHYYDNSIWVVV